MLRTALFLCLLGLLAAAPATARPTGTTGWFWLSKPERHGSRKLAGDFTPVYKNYRYHSRRQRGLLGFLHHSSPVARHHKARPKATSTRKHTTTGLF
jgi:hypothetical protein